MPDHVRTVIKCAIASRVLLLTLILLWRSLVSPYDTSASLNPSCLSPSSISTALDAANSVFSPSIGSAIEESIVWDSVYFVRIAQCGYEYEQSYAFFPLLPVLISLFSNTVFWPLVPVIGYRAVLGLSGYVINNIAFVFAAVYFYRLSLLILRDPEASLRASVLLCFNPASIFYSSIYSESLYALFSIGGVYYLMSGSSSISVLWFALSGSVRSNGVLNAGYVGFRALHQSYNAFHAKRRPFLSLRILVAGALHCICIFIPFLAFQGYGYCSICHGHTPDELRPWCKARVPSLYSFIQSHYWGVGFLRYFQLKQLPNFLLASPVLSMAACSLYSYVKSDPTIVLSLGFAAAVEEKNSSPVLVSGGEDLSRHDGDLKAKQENCDLRRRRQRIKIENTAAFYGKNASSVESGYYSITVLPFLLHLAFMGATAIFVMHVQVATRFLSGSPPLYWFASYLMASPHCNRRWLYLIWTYAIAYILLGSLLFSNFYPFT